MEELMVNIATTFGYSPRDFYSTLMIATLCLSLLTWFKIPLSLFVGFFLMFAEYYTAGVIVIIAHFIIIFVCAVIYAKYLHVEEP